MCPNEDSPRDLDLPEELQSLEEIQRYIAKAVDRETQKTQPSQVDRQETSDGAKPPIKKKKGRGSPIPNAAALRNQLSQAKRSDSKLPELQAKLKTSQLQLARLHQQYNLAASRIHRGTRRKMLLRAIHREQMRADVLQSEIKSSTSKTDSRT